MKTLEQAQNDYREAFSKSHVRFKCSQCQKDIVGAIKESTHILFEPKEIEQEYIDVQYDENDNIIGHQSRKVKETASSDWKKDDFVFKCPCCGHYEHISGEEMTKHHCDGFGINTIRFSLNEKEYQKAKEFMRNHKHEEEDRGAVGGGTEFSFMPTSIGDCIKIKCLLCGESLDITDIESW